MIKRIKKYARSVARFARKSARTLRKEARRLWRLHLELLARDPGYRRLLRSTAAFLLDLASLPRGVSAALMAVLEHVATTQQRTRLTALPY